jgi:hypothetical protein
VTSKEKVIAALSRHFRSPEAVRARDVGGLDYLVIDVVKGTPLIFGFVLEGGEGPLPSWSYCCNAVFIVATGDTETVTGRSKRPGWVGILSVTDKGIKVLSSPEPQVSPVPLETGSVLTLSRAVARTAMQEVLSPAGHQDWVASAQAAPEGCVAVDGTGTAWQKDFDGPLWRRIGSLSGCWYSLDEDADYIASTFGPLRLIGVIA